MLAQGGEQTFGGERDICRQAFPQALLKTLPALEIDFVILSRQSLVKDLPVDG